MLNKLSHFFMRRRNWTVPYALFLLVFVIVPLLLIVLYAFTDDGGAFTLANFRKFMMHPEAMNTFVYSIGIAVITTLVCLLLGYPAAYILSQKQFNTSRTMVVLFILPMWVNILIRTLATVALFDFLNLPTVSTFAIAELLTMNNIKLFGTTVQENIYNGMWNYGAALSLIMLLLIGITILFTNEEDGASNESGGVI